MLSTTLNYYNYFTEIEEHFVRRRGKHLLVSPLDWNLIASWRASGVPLNVALRGIDIAVDNYLGKTRRPGEKLSTLAYCHDSVMSEYARHMESCVGEESAAEGEAEAKSGGRKPAGGMDKSEVMALISERIREIKTAREKQSVDGIREEINRALTRLEEIGQALQSDAQADFEAIERDLGILDEILVEGLRHSVPNDQIAAWEQEAKKDLKVYKKRLPKDLFLKIRENYMRGKVHKLFNIGDLSLFHL